MLQVRVKFAQSVVTSFDYLSPETTFSTVLLILFFKPYSDLVGGWGGTILPTETLNVNNLFNIEVNATKLRDLF